MFAPDQIPDGRTGGGHSLGLIYVLPYYFSCGYLIMLIIRLAFLGVFPQNRPQAPLNPQIMAQHTDVSLPEIRYTRADSLRCAPICNACHSVASPPCISPTMILSDWAAILRQPCVSDSKRCVIAWSSTPTRQSLPGRDAAECPTFRAVVAQTRRFLGQGRESDQHGPKRQDSISAWLRPRVAAVLRDESSTLRRIDGANWRSAAPVVEAGTLSWRWQGAASGNLDFPP